MSGRTNPSACCTAGPASRWPKRWAASPRNYCVDMTRFSLRRPGDQCQPRAFGALGPRHGHGATDPPRGALAGLGHPDRGRSRGGSCCVSRLDHVGARSAPRVAPAADGEAPLMKPRIRSNAVRAAAAASASCWRAAGSRVRSRCPRSRAGSSSAGATGRLLHAPPARHRRDASPGRPARLRHADAGAGARQPSTRQPDRPTHVPGDLRAARRRPRPPRQPAKPTTNANRRRRCRAAIRATSRGG